MTRSKTTELTAPAPTQYRDSDLKVLNLSTLLGILYLVMAFPLFAYAIPNQFLLLEHIPLAIATILNFAYANLAKDPSTGRYILLYLASAHAMVLTFNGAAYNVGVYTMMPVYIFTFFLAGARIGSYIILSLFGIFAGGYTLYLLDLITLPYSKQNFGFFLFCYLLAYIFFILYAKQKERLDAQLQISLDQNELLVNQLKHEKAGAESKVRQRTRQLSEAQAELIASIRSLPFGFAIINDQQQITLANTRLGQLLGHPMPQYGTVSELDFSQVAGDLAAEVKLGQLIAQSQTKRRSIERNITHKNLFIRLFITPIVGDHDQVIGSVLILEDTTEQKILDRSRDEFFSIASHELRTPLTAIRGNIGMILSYYEDKIKDKDMHQMLTDSHDASIRLIQIVNDFLDASRLEQGRLVFKIEAIDATALIEDIVREYRPTAAAHKLKLQLEHTARVMPLVLADRDRTRQIITNLVSNAIKYTPSGGHITLKPAVEGKMMQLQVEDTGQGIPAISRPLLFRKFQQAANNILTRDNTRSTGLGLYIARLMAQNMHGRLFLEKSEVGRGSTFTLQLPLAPHGKE